MYAEKNCSQGFKSLLLVGPCEDVLVSRAQRLSEKHKLCRTRAKEKKLGDPFKTASEKFHRRQAQMKQPVAEACSDQRDDHPTDERHVCSGLSPSPCASASLMLQ